MRSYPARWCAAFVVLSILLASFVAAPAPPTQASQEAGATINVDSPIDGQTFPAGTEIAYTGWAVHPGGPGTGIDRVVIWDAPIDQHDPPPNMIAEASYGHVRI